jgi:hypothetical protein
MFRKAEAPRQRRGLTVLTTKSVRTYSPNPSGFTILPYFTSVLFRILPLCEKETLERDFGPQLELLGTGNQSRIGLAGILGDYPLPFHSMFALDALTNTSGF